MTDKTIIKGLRSLALIPGKDCEMICRLLNLQLSADYCLYMVPTFRTF